MILEDKFKVKSYFCHSREKRSVFEVWSSRFETAQDANNIHDSLLSVGLVIKKLFFKKKNKK